MVQRRSPSWDLLVLATAVELAGAARGDRKFLNSLGTDGRFRWKEPFPSEKFHISYRNHKHAHEHTDSEDHHPNHPWSHKVDHTGFVGVHDHKHNHSPTQENNGKPLRVYPRRGDLVEKLKNSADSPAANQPLTTTNTGSAESLSAAKDVSQTVDVDSTQTATTNVSSARRGTGRRVVMNVVLVILVVLCLASSVGIGVLIYLCITKSNNKQDSVDEGSAAAPADSHEERALALDAPQRSPPGDDDESDSVENYQSRDAREPIRATAPPMQDSSYEQRTLSPDRDFVVSPISPRARATLQTYRTSFMDGIEVFETPREQEPEVSPEGYSSGQRHKHRLRHQVSHDSDDNSGDLEVKKRHVTGEQLHGLAKPDYADCGGLNPVVEDVVNNRLVIEDITLGSPSASDELNNRCVVCLIDQRSTVFVPCGHLACCADCADTLAAKKAKCPICRSQLQKVIKNVVLA